MKMACFGLSVVIVGWINGLLGGQTISGEENSRQFLFLYVAEPERRVAPLYREIEMGLPGGITREQLLADLDPELNSEWEFGWFTYGEGNSRSVAVALRSASHAELFVDIDRNKRFAMEERSERDPEDPQRWRVAIPAEFLTDGNQYDHLERSILVRHSGRRGFEIATEGVMRGSVLVDGKWMRVVRVDRDANGRWFDSSDRIMLDMNGDGKVDPIGERISCEPVCRINGKRFVVQSDMQGERLEFVEVSGLGRIVPQLKLQSGSARIRDISATMVSRDGVRVAIRNLDEPIEGPVGDYRMESLTLDVADGQLNYWFQFSSHGIAKHRIAVKTGQSVAADLLGELTLNGARSVVLNRAGGSLIITPLLETSSGLCLTGCKIGRGRPELENRLLTESSFGIRIIDNGSSGFS